MYLKHLNASLKQNSINAFDHSTSLSLPDFSEQSVNVPTFGHHPGEGGQEEIMETHGNGVAELVQGCRV